jgi:uncharacterized protein YjbJ (UPF0337 family)
VNPIIIRADWSDQKKKLKQQFAILTENDLLITEGRKEELFARLEIRLGKTKEELFKLLAEL